MAKLSNQYVREFNTRTLAERYEGEYEFNRWFSASQMRADYFMNYSTILRMLDGKTFSRCLELGPGPGTWTRVLFRQNPSAVFDLVDLSEEMQEQFGREMGAVQKNVRYILSDIMHYASDNQYDFFFSSRAFEYLDDKDGFIKKLTQLLAPGAHGIIITKNPIYWAKRTSGRLLHSAQMSPLELKGLLEKHDFENIQCTPAVMRIGANIPGFGIFSVYFSEKMFRRFGSNSLLKHPQLLRYSESYAISFSRSR